MVLAFGWQSGEPFTAAAFVVFFTSRVARSIVKRPLGGHVHRDPAAHARRFLAVTAAGWFGSATLALAAALSGEGQEWLYVAPLFFIMGALQVLVMLWSERAMAAPRKATGVTRWLPWTAAAIVGAIAGAAWLAANRGASKTAAPSNRRLKLEVVGGRQRSAVSIRNVDAFDWTRVKTVIGQGDEHAYDCEMVARVPPNTVMTVDVQRCLSEDGVAADASHGVASFTITADQGFATSQRQ